VIPPTSRALFRPKQCHDQISDRDTGLRMWLSRNVRQVCDGGLSGRPKYLDTVACAISMPSFWSSP
jgi:hypothetical protein